MNSHVPIADFAALLHSREDRFRAMALVHAYFDESGIHAGSPIVAVGGLLGGEKAWSAIEADWLIELERFREQGFPISAFHATDCTRGDGEFFGIQKEIRETFFGRLANIIERHSPVCIWSVIAWEDWDELADVKFLSAYPHPLDLCFEWCAYELNRWQEEVGQASPIALVYSEQQEFASRVEALWKAYDRARKIARLNSFTTTSYKTCVPLQAADLVAYECYQHWLQFDYGRGPLAARPGASALVTSSSNIEMMGHHTRETLKEVIRQYHAGQWPFSLR